jgi:hypothetical protein
MLAGGLAMAGAGTPRIARAGENAGPAPLSVPEIVRLHLDHLSRCGAAAADRAAAIAPLALAAARRHQRGCNRPAAVAFDLLEHIGEFPPVHRPIGGLQ